MPLILNPFYGYKDEDRNILNPFMDETVKELSSIDGAFIIRGDGVLVFAGSISFMLLRSYASTSQRSTVAATLPLRPSRKQSIVFASSFPVALVK